MRGSLHLRGIRLRGSVDSFSLSGLAPVITEGQIGGRNDCGQLVSFRVELLLSGNQPRPPNVQKLKHKPDLTHGFGGNDDLSCGKKLNQTV